MVNQQGGGRLTAVAALTLVLMNMAAEWFGSPIMDWIAFSSRFEAIGRGVIDFRDVLYFLSFAALYLYVNAIDVRVRRFR